MGLMNHAVLGSGFRVWGSLAAGCKVGAPCHFEAFCTMLVQESWTIIMVLS